ncbi:MAG: Transcriptional regulator of nonfermentable carbon utilization [Phylliscum demangeonii]|nr:MAG: Transcriptional regulator of nonfermentable carbon utilization [Phylliscum demangeonii]
MADQLDTSTDSDEHPHLKETLEQQHGPTLSAGHSALPTSHDSSTRAAMVRDPSRPKRKKARRACQACQRAHLTCGDERPCGRCIKRGLQDSCHDGTRKKAKYLHDAPHDALAPGLITRRMGSVSNGHPPAMAGVKPVPVTPLNLAGPAPFYAPDPPPPAASSYAVYQPSPGLPQQQPLPPPPPPQDLRSQSSPMTPAFPPAVSQHGTPQLPIQSSSPLAVSQTAGAFVGSMSDPSDAALFNIDLASLNFGNHYGALEFGMLGHMSSGAVETPPLEASPGQLGHASGRGPGSEFAPSDMMSSSAYGPTPASADYPFGGGGGGDSTMSDWADGPAPRVGLNPLSFERSSYGSVSGDAIHPMAAHGYTIGAGASSATGIDPHHHHPHHHHQPPGAVFDAYSATSSNGHSFPDSSGGEGLADGMPHPHAGYRASRPASPQAANGSGPGAGASRRGRDPSSIYESVTEPYSYTAGFHALTALLQRRFSAQKTLRIAKSLASIRPSFISCTKPLNQEDLIFMEKCFQRTLWEYEDFINACATPTIVCRRTGEVAAVGKEFSILTGWRKEVLLGKEANWNINTGGGSHGTTSATSTASSVKGTSSPRGAPATADGTKSATSSGGGDDGPEARPQSVFLAELLDDDSVIKFYEDFAKLAFGDSRGSVITRCKLLKYKTRHGPAAAAASTTTPATAGVGRNGAVDDHRPAPGVVHNDGGSDGSSHAAGPNNHTNNHHHHHNHKMHRKGQQAAAAAARRGMSSGRIAGEASIDRLESLDGTVDCICCWTVKRDVFDMPMLIVMNFLPCI